VCAERYKVMCSGLCDHRNEEAELHLEVRAVRTQVESFTPCGCTGSLFVWPGLPTFRYDEMKCHIASWLFLLLIFCCSTCLYRFCIANRGSILHHRLLPNAIFCYDVTLLTTDLSVVLLTETWCGNRYLVN